MNKETLEEAAEAFEYTDGIYGFKAGAKWQAERMYSEEEVYNLLCQFPNEEELNNWFEQNKKK